MAFFAIMQTTVPYVLRYGGKLRGNITKLIKVIRAHGLVVLLPAVLRSGSKRVLIFGRFSVPLNAMVVFGGGLAMTVLFSVIVLLLGGLLSDSSTPIVECSCDFGICAPGSAPCVSCAPGYDLSGDGYCRPVSCACQHGACAPLAPDRCAVCEDSFQLTADGMCIRGDCECANGQCSDATSYCTSCEPGFELRSTGRRPLNSARGGMFFGTPICINEILLRSEGECMSKASFFGAFFFFLIFIYPGNCTI
jgi:hypothetical protein